MKEKFLFSPFFYLFLALLFTITTNYVLEFIFYFFKIMLIPIGLIAWLAVRGISKIPNKTARTICYVVLAIIILVAIAAMDEAGFKFCYKGHC